MPRTRQWARDVAVACMVSVLSGCAAAENAVPAPISANATCRVERVQALVGKALAADGADRARRRARARIVRVVPAGAMMTMDFRPDRLTIILGTDGKVGRISCG